MGDGGKSGLWIFRNQHWYYQPAGSSLLELEPRTVDRDALAALVDPSDLLVQIGTLVRVSQLPVLSVFVDGRTSVEEWERTSPRVTVGAPEPCRPDWLVDVDAVGRQLVEALEESLVEASRLAVTRGKPVVIESFFGPDSVQATPIGFPFGEKRYIHGAVATLVAGCDLLPAPEVLAQRAGVDVGQAAAFRDLLARVLPDLVRAREHAALLATVVTAYSARVQETLTHRLELASEQARSRHHLVRAETLERKLLTSGGSGEPMVRESHALGRELESLLEIPDVAITLEDTDYVVRYINPTMQRHFGNVVGRKCYEAFKGRSSPCHPCVLKQTWEDGETYVTYTTSDPRSGRSYEIMAVPVVGRQGEKLVLELGVEVTRSERALRKLQEETGALKRRTAAMAELFDRLGERVGALVQEMGTALMARPEGAGALSAAPWPGGVEGGEPEAESLAEPRVALMRSLATLSSTAVSLQQGAGIAPVDIREMILRLCSELGFPGKGRAADLDVQGIPLILTLPDIAERLFRMLLEDLLCRAGYVPRRMVVSHTMSGHPSTLVPGDRYHMLTLAARGQVSRDGHPLGAVRSEDIPDLAALLALRLGVSLWSMADKDGRTYYLSVPVSPPEG